MTHWPSKWFEIRSELGQSDLATMMFQDGHGVLHKHHFHHREADGFGKIQSLLKSEGIEILPPIRQLKKPHRFLNFYLLIKGLLTHPHLPYNPWKVYRPKFSSGHPDEVSTWFLTDEENKQVKLLAQEKKLNLSFYFLSELDQILKKHLFNSPNESSTWLTPVDVRGAYPNAKINDNYVSFIATKLRKGHIHEAFEKYKSDLRTGVYWAFWELAQIGQYVGLSGMRWLAKKGTGQSFWMGSFSDLGVWNQQKLLDSKIKNRYWCIAPPGSLTYPVGVTTIEWCGHRSLTIKIHPAICSEHNKVISDQILSEFKNRVLTK